ncbi:MAG: hypothetical protein MJZ71_05125 [Bacteroidales bacterium]|nr:hypothetical protein [Bacteroidales bacterium]
MKKQLTKIKRISSKLICTISLSGAICFSMNAYCQDKNNEKGKPIVTIFDNFGATRHIDEKETELGFNLERAYIGYQYQFSENWGAKIVYDMGKGDDNSLQRLGYVKNAEISFKKDGFKLNVGLTSTKQFKVQEDFWGNRYIYKSFLDKRKWASSADLGITIEQKLAEWLSTDVSIMNGEGYKKIQSDNQLQYSIGVTSKPIKGLSLRAFADCKTAEDKKAQSNIGLFAGYKNDILKVGAEYNMQFNNANIDGHNLSGFSIYATSKLGNSSEVYARYDFNDSSLDIDNDTWQYKHNGQTAIIGYQYKVNKLLQISPNIQYNIDNNDNKSFSFFLNTKISL